MTEQLLVRGFLASINVIPPLVVKFQFNPESISDNKSVNFVDKQTGVTGNAPGKYYKGGGDRTISFDLKLHGLEKKADSNLSDPQSRISVHTSTPGITVELAQLRSFLYPKEDAWSSLGQIFGINKDGRSLCSPPECIFGFGDKVLECVVTEMTVNETQFNNNLVPVRADVSITLVVREDEESAFFQLDRQRRNSLAALGLGTVNDY